MFESYYNLSANPFRLSADEHFRFAHKNYLKAWSYLRYALEQGEGFVMVTGQPGSGKTTLIRDILSELDSSKVLAINLVTNQLQAEELLRKVALEYGLPAETYNKATLLTHIEDFVTKKYREGRRAIIVIDEAQNLTLNGLEELRLLSNLQTGSYPLFQIFLVGQDSLRTLILSPEMEQIRQRLIASCQIESMNIQQTEGYIEHRLSIVGWNQDPEFDEVIFPLIHYLTEGIPRKINHIVSRLLLYGALESKHKFTEEDVWIVAKELFEEERLSIQSGESFTEFKEKYEQEDEREVEQYKSSTSTPNVESLQDIDEEDIGHGELGSELLKDKVSETESLAKPEPRHEPEIGGVIDSEAGGKSREPRSEFSTYGEELIESDDTSVDVVSTEDQVLKDSVAFDTTEKTDHITEVPNVEQIARTSGKNYPSEAKLDISISQVLEKTKPKEGEVAKQSGISKPEDILNLPSMQAEKRKHDIDEKGGLINTAETFDVEELFSGTITQSLRNVFLFVLVGLFFLALFVIPPQQIDRVWDRIVLKFQQMINPHEEAQEPIAPTVDHKQQKTEVLDDNIQQKNELKIDKQVTETSITEAVQEQIESSEVSIPKGVDNATMDSDSKSDMETGQMPENLRPTVKTDSVESASKDYIATQSKYQKVEIGETSEEIAVSTSLDRTFQIYFEFDNTSIPEQFKEMLNDLYIVLSLNKASTMTITGYTDASGDPIYNMNLSMDRAQTVSRYFIERGIEAERIQVNGGGAVPKSTEDEYETLEKRFGNRRVEIILREGNK